MTPLENLAKTMAATDRVIRASNVVVLILAAVVLLAAAVRLVVLWRAW